MAASRHLLDGIGIWAEFRRVALATCGPMLLLDRDGVVIHDAGYVGRRDAVRLCDGVGPAIARANRLDVPVAIVTNQSGIARGFYGWDGFVEVQDAIDSMLSKHGARIDAILACGYHEDGDNGLAVTNHPWRKPRPGMLNTALDVLNGDRTRSAMIGDQNSDMEAALAAGIQTSVLVTELGPTATECRSSVAVSPAEAIDRWLDGIHVPVQAVSDVFRTSR
jgi:D-glycero-D-manno-heptose 1,7-bisphosphate phosphatase